MEKRKSLIDVAVAMVFFNRPKQLGVVFESVKKAAPSKLFLIQDGAREGNENDVSNIRACREIVSQVDWECEVVEIYSDCNLGCGKRISSGVTEAFTHVDRLIILEDDCLPSDSFYPFCKDILDFYIDDPRVDMISGMNHLGEFSATTDDYMFATVGSIAGWATWKRAWDKIDFTLSSFEDKNIQRLIKNHSPDVYELIKSLKQKIDNKEKLSSWSGQRGFSAIMNSGLVVVPRVNLMSNIGVADGGVHTPSDMRIIPRSQRWLYNLKLYDMNFPLAHPDYVIEDVEYSNAVLNKANSKGIAKLFVTVEKVVRKLLYGDKDSIKKAIRRRLHK